MTRLSRLPPRDLEALSAYADGRLSPVERQPMDARLQEDPALRRALDEIRATSALLRALPSVRPPRNFLLTPEMAGVRRRWLGYPALQLATAMATLAFFVTVGLDVFAPVAGSVAFRAAAPSEEMAMQAAALQPALPTEAGAAALEAGALSVVAETAMPAITATELSVADAVQESAPNAAPSLEPGEYASRDVPGVGGGGEMPPAPLEAATPPPSATPAESGATPPGCEACGGDQLLPDATPVQKAVGEAATPGAGATTLEPPAAAMPEGEGVMPETFALETQAQMEPAAEVPPPAGMPLVRWLEIGLAGGALLLGGLSLWARRKTG
jgi:anti-sigma factor RsiW